MAWIYLLLAGLFEIGWPVGLKWGWSESGTHVGWIAFAIVCIAISGTLLLLAQQEIPIGTAYAVWGGIGAVGTFALGIAMFGDPPSAMRIVAAGLIVAGIVGLKLA
jgi:quaternary ammonium compound-resistance protein SugE